MGKNVSCVALDFHSDILPQIMDKLFRNNIQSLLVEGGASLSQSFIDAGLWDEIYIEHAQSVLGDGVKAPQVPAGYKAEYELRDGVTVSHYVR